MLMSAIEFEGSHVERGSVDFSFTCLLLFIYLPHLVQFRKKKKNSRAIDVYGRLTVA